MYFQIGIGVIMKSGNLFSSYKFKSIKYLILFLIILQITSNEKCTINFV